MNPRATAAKILVSVLQGLSLTEAFNYHIYPSLPASEQSLMKELCFGSLRWYPRLATLAQKLLHKPIKAKDQDIHCLLLIGLYQLCELRIPAHAAVTETVNAARALQKDWACRLINGLLRRFQRERATLLAQLNHEPVAHYAHPDWLLTRLQQAWPQTWPAIVEANNQRPPLSLRVNLLKQSRNDYLAQLQQQAIAAEPIPYTPSGLVLASPMAVTQLPGFGQGAVSVQDGAAQLAAPLLELSPGLTVLDACAAPGGKTAHILETEPALAKVVAIDKDPARLERVAENLARLHLQATLVAADASQTATWWDGQLFDRILLDAPCSATGVMRRHPDIKLLRRASDIATLVTHQYQLLTALWPLLKPQGLLVYATCSLLPAENSDLIQRFLQDRPEAQEKPIIAAWGEATVVGRQILTGTATMDGFYYARLQKMG